MNNLAILYQSQGDYALALPLLQKCLERRKEKLGEDHPDTVTIMNNLAGLYESQGDYASALALYLKCVEKRKEKLGEDHPNTLSTMKNLAGLYKSQREGGIGLPRRSNHNEQSCRIV